MTPQELKNSILQLAIQGKLVEQRPEEGTAAELLEKILATSAFAKASASAKATTDKSADKKNAKGAKVGSRVPRDRNGRAVAPRPPIPDDEKPFDIPESWEWCRVGDVFSHNTGKAMNSSAKATTKSGTIRKFITTSNVYWNNFDLSSLKEMFFSDDELDRCSATKNDLLMCEGGAYYGRTAIWKKDYDICFQNHIHRLRSYVPICEDFFYHVFFLYRNNGMMQPKGTAMPGLSSIALQNLLIPLPPLAEQKRIVAKIEELLPLIDRYEKAWSKLEDFNKRFPVDMQKSLLQMAIQGKLVEQRPEEGTAAELLRDILTQRRRDTECAEVGRDHRARRNGSATVPRPPIPDDEKPFDIPESWEWVRLGEVASIERGSGIKRSETSSSGFPCVRYGEIYTTYGYSFTSTKSFVTENVASSCHKANYGDVLCTLTGEWKEEIAKATAYLGKSPIAVGGDLAKVSSHVFNPVLLVYFFFAPFMIQQKASKANGTMIVHIGKEAVGNLLIPLPPLAEQKRIVAKLEELLPLCERLKGSVPL